MSRDELIEKARDLFAPFLTDELEDDDTWVYEALVALCQPQ